MPALRGTCVGSSLCVDSYSERPKVGSDLIVSRLDCSVKWQRI